MCKAQAIVSTGVWCHSYGACATVAGVQGLPEMRARVSRDCLGLLCASFGMAIPAFGGELTDPRADTFALSVRTETYAELFRRALLPGPSGSIVETNTELPIHQFAFLRAQGMDVGWCNDCVDVELSAWGSAWGPAWRGGGTETEGPIFGGDVQTAHVTHRLGPTEMRLGRQSATGGAARYVRFDGLAIDAALGAGFDVGAYAGWTVLPRWDQPAYHQLGAATDSLLRHPDSLPEPDRSGYHLAGGRVGWASERVQAAASVHNQEEPTGLSRRTLGLDAQTSLLPETVVGMAGLLELDALRPQQARLWADVSPWETTRLSLEMLHTEPALFLSRQSVLSVFSTEAYQEVGGTAGYRFSDGFGITSGGWVEFYDQDRRGARGEVTADMSPGQTQIRCGYGRVVAIGNGYHSLRASAMRKIVANLSGTLEAYGYRYDSPIRGQGVSLYAAGTLLAHVAPEASFLWGVSIARSPYANVDAQTLVRFAWALDGLNGSP